jgi:hypothetical protein
MGAITTNVVSVVYLSKEDFFRILEDFPEDKEKYHKLKDTINMYKSSRGLGIKCPACGKFSHSIKMCPCVTFVLNKE